MKTYRITHPHALMAIYLAHCMKRGASRAWITWQLKESGLPRSLYVLACILQAAESVTPVDKKLPDLIA